MLFRSRNACQAFEIAGDIDPVYEKKGRDALSNGVKSLVYACDVSPKGITITRPLTFKIKQW